MQKGRISSIQSMGAVDGPGLRCVVFLQGCPLRCAYCHNPETWPMEGGEEMDLSDLLAKIERLRPYFQQGGGVTVSGGEPLLQWEFVAELFSHLQDRGIHTALDTSGVGSLPGASEVLPYTNLVICDLKFCNEQDFRKHCHGDLRQVYDFLALTAERSVPLWIRQVIVPGLNDTKESILSLKEQARQYPNLEQIELLPFRTLCATKYEALGIPFPLQETKDCTEETIRRLEALLTE